jgi:hypothetical protein
MSAIPAIFLIRTNLRQKLFFSVFPRFRGEFGAIR